MTDLAIRTANLSKKYRIEPQNKASYSTLRDVIAHGFKRAVKNLGSASNADKHDRYGKDYIWALRDVDFEVKRGEVVGLIGRNGAGKSTLLKVLTRITDPTQGVVDLYGRVGSLLEVGTGFHKELTGRENVYLNGAILGMKKTEIDRKFDEIVAFAEVEKFINTPVKFYSSGMTVRLAFAVAAHLEPEILLVDEVLAVGDASFQRKCLTKMEDVGREGRTVIFVSHHMPSITRLCERAVLLEGGQIVRNGPAHEVVGEYLSTNLGASSSMSWPDRKRAPGNEVVRLCEVRVKNKAGNTTYNFDIRQPVGLEMTYEVLTPGYVLYPYFTVKNEEDLWLFTTIDTADTFRRKPRQAGRYTSTAWIPGNMLSEGTMMIGPAVRTEEPFMNHFYQQDAVAFQVVDSPDKDGARVDWGGKLPGILRPYLEWETEYHK